MDTSRLEYPRSWDSLSLPAHGIIIRTWCSASMGGLDPDDFEPNQATRLIKVDAAAANNDRLCCSSGVRTYAFAVDTQERTRLFRSPRVASVAGRGCSAVVAASG